MTCLCDLVLLLLIRMRMRVGKYPTRTQQISFVMFWIIIMEKFDKKIVYLLVTIKILSIYNL